MNIPFAVEFEDLPDLQSFNSQTPRGLNISDTSHKRYILIIKLGALGDMVQATTAFYKIKELYPEAQRFLLTRPLYASLVKKLDVFEEIFEDPQKPFYHPVFWGLIKQLRAHTFDIVYDLQHVDRTRFYGKFLNYKGWAAHPDHDHHPQLRFQDLLGEMPGLDLRGLAEPFAPLPPVPYVLVIPGSSKKNQEKRWNHYPQLLDFLVRKGMMPVLIGGPDEDLTFLEREGVMNLQGQTSFENIIFLAERSKGAIGNDTGPMLLAASAGIPTVTFYGAQNPSTRGGPLGAQHYAFDAHTLKGMVLGEVFEKVLKGVGL